MDDEGTHTQTLSSFAGARQKAAWRVDTDRTGRAAKNARGNRSLRHADQNPTATHGPHVFVEGSYEPRAAATDSASRRTIKLSTSRPPRAFDSWMSDAGTLFADVGSWPTAE